MSTRFENLANKKGSLPMKNNDTIPTVGEWYHSLPGWKRLLFNVLSRIVGDMNAIEWCGYHHAKRSQGEKDEASSI